jgi:hypothetical protein
MTWGSQASIGVVDLECFVIVNVETDNFFAANIKGKYFDMLYLVYSGFSII